MTTSTRDNRPTADIADPATIRRALDLLVAQDGVVEIRAVHVPVGRGKPCTVAGYFADLDRATEAAVGLDKRKAGGIYLTLNEVNPALLARSPNILTDYLDPTTSDSDILRRRWLPIDLDATRPAGISSTDTEHGAARMLAQAIRLDLTGRGWPLPIYADSGNGAHLLYRIDLPAKDAGLVERCLKTLAEEYADYPMVKVDTATANPARIWKLYGTHARKGHNTSDRPHRLARLIDAPEPVEVVPVEFLEALASTIKKPEPAQRAAGGNGDSDSFTSRLDVPRWLSERGVGFHRREQPDGKGRTVFILERCPFDANHGGNGESVITQEPSGKLGAKCLHNSCAGHGWQEFKDRIGPPTADHWDPPLADHRHNGQTSGGEPAGDGERLASGTKPTEPPLFTKLLTGAALLALDLRPRFLVRGVLVEGQPMIMGGRSKTLKTSLALDLAISLGSGTPFLGRFDAQRAGVAFWSGESGAATIRETARRIADAKGVDLAGVDVLWCFDLPRLSHLDHLAHLAAMIRGEGLRVAILDPLYLALLSPETASGASNVFMMGCLLQGLTKLGQDTGCTIILLHHFRKGGQPDEDNPAGLEELAQSGVAEWSRQWILLQRRSPYQGDGKHLLWLRCGGSAGHSSLWGVNIDEGVIDPDTFSGRHWEVEVKPVSDAKQQAKWERENRKAAELEKTEAENVDRVWTALRDNPDGATERRLRTLTHLNADKIDRALLPLEKTGRIEPCKVTTGGGTFDGWKVRKG